MAFSPTGSIGQQLLDVPFPEMIRSMGMAIAQAQYELDMVGMRLAQMMSGKYQREETQLDGTTTLVEVESKIEFGKDKDGNAQKLSLLELGFTPTFYQFVDTLIEVKVSISMNLQREWSRKSSYENMSAVTGAFLCFGGARMSVSSVSASYAGKYQYSAEGSSLMRTKLVPVPAPSVLEERIRNLINAEAGGGDGG